MNKWEKPFLSPKHLNDQYLKCTANLSKSTVITESLQKTGGGCEDATQKEEPKS